MPAHRHTPVARASRLVRVLALALVVALLAAGCGKDKKPKAAEKDPSAAAEPTVSGVRRGGGAPDPGYGAPEVGRCYRLSSAQSLAPVTSKARVKCDTKHTTVVAHVGYVPKAVTAKTPAETKRRAIGKRQCEPAYRKLAGGTVSDRATSLLTWTLFTPSQDQLERGARWIRCDVLARSGDQLVALPNAKPLLEKGVPESLRVCQTAAGIDVSCSQPACLPGRGGVRRLGDRLSRSRPIHRSCPDPLQGADGRGRRLLAAAQQGRLEGRRPLRPVPVPGCFLSWSGACGFETLASLAPQPPG